MRGRGPSTYWLYSVITPQHRIEITPNYLHYSIIHILKHIENSNWYNNGLRRSSYSQVKTRLYVNPLELIAPNHLLGKQI